MHVKSLIGAAAATAAAAIALGTGTGTASAAGLSAKLSVSGHTVTATLTGVQNFASCNLHDANALSFVRTDIGANTAGNITLAVYEPAGTFLMTVECQDYLGRATKLIDGQQVTISESGGGSLGSGSLG